MARLPRLSLPNLPHLVVQQGHNRQAVFADNVDRADYLKALQDAARSHDVALHAYALLPDAVWLLATPVDASGLSLTLQAVGRRYVAGFNRRHGRSGTIWDGRFRATLVEPDWVADRVMRFVEQAPVRAGQAERAGDSPWTSAAHHLGQRTDPLIRTHASYWTLGNTPFDREHVWRQRLDELLPDSLAMQIRDAALKGWPLGGGAFLAQLARQTDRPVTARPRGRPGKVPKSA